MDRQIFNTSFFEGLLTLSPLCHRAWWRFILVFTGACLCALCFEFSPASAFASPARPDIGPRFRAAFAVTGSESYLTQILNNNEKNGGYSVGFRGGFRMGRWGGFLELSLVGWEGYEALNKSHQRSLNVGLGGEVFYFKRRMRTSLAVGVSILQTPAPPDPAGTAGAYVELVPSSYHMRLHRKIAINIAPFTLYVGVPSFEGIPLVVIQYRTTLGVEFTL